VNQSERFGMSLADDIAFVGGLLDAFGKNYCCMGVAAGEPGDAGVPLEMQVGPVNADGWVAWQMLPSTLSEEDLAAVEGEFDVRFPPLFRAYLLARFQLFDQIRSLKYRQPIFMTDVPSSGHLGNLRTLIQDWYPLLGAGYLPFAEWGDGWGPMCFDLRQQNDEGECPVVWMSHEYLIPLGPEMSSRAAVLPWVQPLYGSCREFLLDVFVPAGQFEDSL